MRVGPVLTPSAGAAVLPLGATNFLAFEQLNAPKNVDPHQRVAFLDVCKGTGILLVVMGHCLGGLHEAGIVKEASIPWFAFYLIYSFHMPLFFFLTGSLVETRVNSRPRRFLHSVLTRIGYPYFLWGAVQLIVLSLASTLVTHPVSQQPLQKQLINMLWAPPAQFWFLYALFFLHLIALGTIAAGGKVLFLFTFTVVYSLSVIFPPASGFISSYVSGTNILFYVLGVSIGGLLIAWRAAFAHQYAHTLISIIVFLSVTWAGWSAGIRADTYAALPAAVAGISALILLCTINFLRENKWFAYLGRRALPIYLLHVMFVAGTRIVLIKAFHVDALAVVLPIIFLSGVVGPLFLYHATRALRIGSIAGLA